MNPLLKIVDLHKSFGSLEVLTGVSIDVQKGEKLSIIGPSGSGKTTLLRCINYLEKPSAGHIYVDDKLIGEKNRIKPRRARNGREGGFRCIYVHTCSGT